jgi:hypothetical protein
MKRGRDERRSRVSKMKRGRDERRSRVSKMKRGREERRGGDMGKERRVYFDKRSYSTTRVNT